MRIGLPPAALALAVAGLFVLWLCFMESGRSDDAGTNRRRRRRQQPPLPVPPPVALSGPAAAPRSFVETIAGSSLFTRKTVGDFIRMKHEVNSLDELIKKVDPTAAAAAEEPVVGYGG